MAMAKTSVGFLLSSFLFMLTIKNSLSKDGLPLHCLHNERQALLSFKQGMMDPTNRLSSWVGHDCCKWEGVACNNMTGHVVKLDLRNPAPFNEDRITAWNINDSDHVTADYEKACLKAHEVNPSILMLKHLTYLDLSWNNFSGIKIPMFFGLFQELRYLNLSSSWFGGTVPHHLGNLSELRWLDLSTRKSLPDNFDGFPLLHVDNFHWTSNLFHLQHLDMSGLDLSNIQADIFPAITALPSLLEIQLSRCGLGKTPLLHFHANRSSLETLYLDENFFEGPIPNAIRNMTSLVLLDLSSNEFTSSGPLLDDLRSLNRLKILALSGNQFQTKAIEHSGNFSSPSVRDSLQLLDLSDNQLNGSLPNWLYQLNNLRTLDLSNNLIQGTIPTSFGTLLNLKELNLVGNNLNGSIPGSFEKLLKMEVLGLSSNNFSGSIPSSLGRLSNLRRLEIRSNRLSGQIPASFQRLSNLVLLDLSHNQLIGQIPKSFPRLSNLTILDLSHNLLSGRIPASLGRLIPKLTELDLRSNQLNGTIPESFGQLLELATLDLSENCLSGELSEMHFVKLSKLESLSLGMNSLSLRVSSNWIPPFKLKTIELGSCYVGPHFPNWLRTQTNFNSLNMSNAGISDLIPNWFENLSDKISFIDLSGNKIYGKVPNLVKSSNFPMQIFLGSNRLEGPLPRFPLNLSILDLSNNTISGTIPNDIGDMIPALNGLFLSNNHLNGSIPNSLCKMQSLSYLDLSKNHLSRHLPRCWSGLQILEVIDLTSNKISGSIPGSICQLPFLRSLRMSNNNFHGIIPPELRHCTSLSILDFGENMLSGSIPTWIGESVPTLKFLRIRSNKFHGSVPPKLCHSSNLQILDISNNDLSGYIPHCFGNFRAMMLNQTHGSKGSRYGSLYSDKLSQVIKGRELEYYKILSLVINLDLSSNNFVGRIPEELMRLSGLIGLNLSNNYLRGNIPKRIGQMQSLQSLDFSANRLSGNIPQSISSLLSLSHLNLSYNNLSGQIPTGNQLQTLDDSSIYKGNDELCGPPVEKRCEEDGESHSPTATDDEEDNGFKTNGFYIGLASGFVIGFSSIWVVLLFKKTWRYAYFRFVDDTIDRLYVVIVTRIARIKNLKWN